MTAGAVTTRRRRSIRRRPIGYLFVAPIVLFFVVFVGYPFLRSFYLSLTSWSGLGSPRFVGVRNFRVMTDDPVFWKALGNTFLFTGVTTVLQTALPLLLAVLLNRGWRAGVLFRTLIFIPAVISLVVTGVLWQLIYEPNFGTLNEILRSIGLGGLAHQKEFTQHKKKPYKHRSTKNKRSIMQKQK